VLTHRHVRPDDVPHVCAFPQSVEELFYLFANFYVREKGGACAIGNVVVAPEARGQGVGRYLIETMAAKALREHAAREVRISCFNGNVAGLLLYAELGFAPYAVERRLDPAGARVALIHMRLSEEAAGRLRAP
jgi:GNAT superfamily N-acetyltransferase